MKTVSFRYKMCKHNMKWKHVNFLFILLSLTFIYSQYKTLYIINLSKIMISIMFKDNYC